MDQREALLEAAIRCLQEKGYARTTTRDIVAAAGTHLPAVNYYFGSKDRLLKAAIVEALRRWAASTAEVARDPSAGPPRQLLHRSIDAFLASLESDRAYVVTALEAFAQAPRSDDLRDELAAEYDTARQEIMTSIDRAAPRGDTSSESEADVTDVASLLLALFDGLAIQWLLAPERTLTADGAMRALHLLASVSDAPTEDARGIEDHAEAGL